MKTEISQRYKAVVRSIRASGFLVFEESSNLVILDPRTNEVCYTGKIRGAEKWVLEFDSSYLNTPPAKEIEQGDCDSSSFYKAAVAWFLLSISTSLIAIVTETQNSVLFGGFSVFFLVQAMRNLYHFSTSQNKGE
tara:strand:+ start:1284 stop:1688 length:405 start_codon:yes stop_codon:yes gene_type:complete